MGQTKTSPTVWRPGIDRLTASLFGTSSFFISTISLLFLAHTSRFLETQHLKPPPTEQRNCRSRSSREPTRQSSSACRSGSCFCCISKDAYFSSLYHDAKEVIITKCEAVRNSPTSNACSSLIQLGQMRVILLSREQGQKASQCSNI